MSVLFFLVSSIGDVALSSRQVVGGTPIQVQAAPWAVLVRQGSSTGTLQCGGTIIDAVHIVTAAHCVYDLNGNQAQPSALSVRAGISNVVPLATDGEQDRAVSSISVDPGYVWTLGAGVDDVALLTLAAPLDLTGTAVQAIALPTLGAAYPAGAQAELAGFGRQSAAAPSDGSLQQMSATVAAQAACAAAGTGTSPTNPASLCASSGSSAVCFGDSGSGLVTAGSPPTLVGVVSSGPADCSPGSSGLFTYIGAPEILSFLPTEPTTAPAALAPTASITHTHRDHPTLRRRPRRASPSTTSG